ncbi:DUF4383 domain-containing protein [Pilimelia columellifera]|uniref:DUF4383 domain-containing protein n=1 Tax=Pilimelia columellifera subsp. columellifera TaxID=706583 RepID=A0ABN3NLY7_9ACTN
MSSHDPVVNHPLRPLYRALALATGAFLVLFGALGLIETAGAALFARASAHALGLQVNLASAIVSLALGAVVLAVTLIGRNLDHKVNQWLGYGLFAVTSVMLALIQTDGNVLNFGIGNVIVLYSLGLVLLGAGLYSRVAPTAARA